MDANTLGVVITISAFGVMALVAVIAGVVATVSAVVSQHTKPGRKGNE